MTQSLTLYLVLLLAVALVVTKSDDLYAKQQFTVPPQSLGKTDTETSFSGVSDQSSQENLWVDYAVTTSSMTSSDKPLPKKATVKCDRINETFATCRWSPELAGQTWNLSATTGNFSISNVTNSSELSFGYLQNCTSYWFLLQAGLDAVRCWIPPVNLNQILHPNPLHSVELKPSLKQLSNCQDSVSNWSYTLLYQAVNSTESYTTTISINQTEMKPENLPTCTLYDVTVLSQSPDVNHTYSALDLVQQLQVHLSVHNVTEGSISVSWNPIDSACNLLHELTISNETSTINYTSGGNSTDFSFANLRPYTKYSIVLKRCVELKNGKYCGKENITSATTNESVPDAPNVSVDLNLTHVNVTWTAPPNPNGIIKNYNVSWKVIETNSGNPDSVEDWTYEEMVNGSTMYLYQKFNFYGCSVYIFNVTGGTSAGFGIANSTVRNTSVHVSSPLVHQVTAVAGKGDLKITLQSNKDETCFKLIKYRVELKAVDDDKDKRILQGYSDSDSPNMNFPTLPYTNYSVVIYRFINDSSFGTWLESSITEIVETNETSPANFSINSVRKCHALNESDMQCDVTWNQPNPINGRLQKYAVYYSCKKIASEIEPFSGGTYAEGEKLNLYLPPYANCNVTVVASTFGGQTRTDYNFHTDVSYPPPVSFDWQYKLVEAVENAVVQDPTTQINVSLSFNPFSEENGPISLIDVWYRSVEEEKHQNGDDDSLPNIGCTSLLTPADKKFPVHCVIKNLNPSTKYTIVLRGCTSEEEELCRKINFIISTQDSKGPIIMVVTLLIVLILLSIVVSVLIYLHKKMKPRIVTRSDTGDEKNSEHELEFLGPIHSVAVRPGVAISEFTHYVETMHRDANLLFQKEYVKLCSEAPRYACNAANVELNKSKNRYKDVLPFDLSRVKLLGGENEDFINANYMPGFHSRREYIATQGPLLSTICDFWRMIWEQNIRVIVMLTLTVENGKLKCEKYWPNNAETLVISNGSIFHATVTCKSEMVTSDYTIRVFTFTTGSGERTVVHCHFTTWPDRACPSSRTVMIGFVREVRKYQPKENFSPICVHCSAGVGRTGTFITIDRLMQEITNGRKEIRVFEAVMDLRYNRCTMVQNEEQYVFIHDCIVEFLHELHLKHSFVVETEKRNGELTTKL